MGGAEGHRYQRVAGTGSSLRPASVGLNGSRSRGADLLVRFTVELFTIAFTSHAFEDKEKEIK